MRKERGAAAGCAAAGRVVRGSRALLRHGAVALFARPLRLFTHVSRLLRHGAVALFARPPRLFTHVSRLLRHGAVALFARPPLCSHMCDRLVCFFLPVNSVPSVAPAIPKIAPLRKCL